jgi:hypothetical protein
MAENDGFRSDVIGGDGLVGRGINVAVADSAVINMVSRRCDEVH